MNGALSEDWFIEVVRIYEVMWYFVGEIYRNLMVGIEFWGLSYELSAYRLINLKTQSNMNVCSHKFSFKVLTVSENSKFYKVDLPLQLSTSESFSKIASLANSQF